jgi:glycosyltransferase involved in cell wall biosynthesis
VKLEARVAVSSCESHAVDREPASPDSEERAALRTLHVIGTLDPAWGGPVEAAASIAIGSAEFGLESELLTLDAANQRWIGDYPVKVHALGPSIGRYRYCASLMPWLESHCWQYDAVIVHGIWQFQSAAVHAVCQRVGRPYYVFLHGALDPWFQRRYPLKHAKKLLYWRLVEHRVLRDATAVLFSNEMEHVAAARTFRPFQCRAEVVPLGIADPGVLPNGANAFTSSHAGLSGARILLHLGRIHPVKGSDLLLRAFAAVCSRDDRLRLVMAGPDEVGWKQSLERLADALGIADRVTWTGNLSGEEKWGAFRAAEVVVLPSHSESFGVVVVEALACGVPVLISNKVKIWREVAASGACLVENDSLAGSVALLERWMMLNEADRELMRERARTCYLANYEISSVCRDFSDLIRRTLRVPGVDGL